MIKQLLQELRSNPRLRIGLVLVLSILWLNALLNSRDDIDVLRRDMQRAKTKVVRLQAGSSQAAWIDRAAEAEAARKSIETMLWTDQAAGLAEATLRDVLTRQLADVGIARSTINIAPIQSGSGAANILSDVRRREAKLDFEFDAKTLQPLLAALAAAQPRIVVQSLSIKRFPSPRVELLIATYQHITPQILQAELKAKP